MIFNIFFHCIDSGDMVRSGAFPYIACPPPKPLPPYLGEKNSIGIELDFLTSDKMDSLKIWDLNK